MIYLVRVYRKGAPSELIYKDTNRGYAWKLFFDWTRSGLNPEDKVKIKERCHSQNSVWKTLKTFTQYY